MTSRQVKAVRRALGLTQLQLADRIAATQVTVARWETGASRPTGAYLKALMELAEKVSDGPVKMGKQTQRSCVMATAYHEAGHAVASFHVNIATKVVSIKPDGESLGHHSTWSYLTRDERTALENSDRFEYGATKATQKVINRGVILLGGCAAEKMFTGRRNAVGAASDLDKFNDLTGMLIPGDAERLAFQRWLMRRTETLLAEQWNYVEAVAVALRDHTTLTGEEFRKVIARV